MNTTSLPVKEGAEKVCDSNFESCLAEQPDSCATNKLSVRLTRAGSALIDRSLAWLGASDPRKLEALRATQKLALLNTALIVSVIPLGMYFMDEAGRFFREGRLMTWLSFFQLLLIGCISGRIYSQSTAPGSNPAKCIWDRPEAFWKLLSVGFILAAFDEILKLHEAVDRYFHFTFGIKITSFSDHLDDLLVALYGVFGLYLIWRYRSYLKKFLGCIPYVIAAGFFGGMSTILDFLSGAKEPLRPYFATEADLIWMLDALGLVEEICKMYAEVAFIGGFLWCLKAAHGALGPQAVVSSEQ